MNCWRSTCCFIIASFALLTVSVCEGMYCNYPTYWKYGCFGDFELGAEFLWWKPCVEDLDYCAIREKTTVNQSTNVELEYKGVCPGWEPGVRVYFDYPDFFCWCKMGIRSSYTYIDSCDNSCNSGGEGVPLILHPGLITDSLTDAICDAKWRSCYHELEALFYFNCCCNECNYIVPSFGIAAIYLEQDLEVSIDTAEGSSSSSMATVDWDSDYWGVGLRAGLEYRYVHNRCLTFYGLVTGSIITGDEDTHNKQFYDGAKICNASFKDSDCFRCVPGYRIGVGAISNCCICGFDFSLRLGYDFIRWHNLPRHRIFSGDDVDEDAALSNSPGGRSFGFHGLSVGIGLYF